MSVGGGTDLDDQEIPIPEDVELYVNILSIIYILTGIALINDNRFISPNEKKKHYHAIYVELNKLIKFPKGATLYIALEDLLGEFLKAAIMCGEFEFGEYCKHTDLDKQLIRSYSSRRYEKFYTEVVLNANKADTFFQIPPTFIVEPAPRTFVNTIQPQDIKNIAMSFYDYEQYLQGHLWVCARFSHWFVGFVSQSIETVALIRSHYLDPVVDFEYIHVLDDIKKSIMNIIEHEDALYWFHKGNIPKVVVPTLLTRRPMGLADVYREKPREEYGPTQNNFIKLRTQLLGFEIKMVNIFNNKKAAKDQEKKFLDSFYAESAKECPSLGGNDIVCISPSTPAPSQESSSVVTAHGQLGKKINIFRKERDSWRICYEGNQINIRHYKGLNYIAKIMQNPNPPTAISSFIIFRDVDANSIAPQHLPGEVDFTDGFSFTESSQEKLPKESRGSYKARLFHLETQLNDAKEQGAGARITEIEEEIKRIKESLNAGEGLSGKPRNIINPNERIADKIAKSIKLAINRIIDSGLESLASHLAAIKREQNGFAYRPGQPPPEWSFD